MSGRRREGAGRGRARREGMRSGSSNCPTTKRIRPLSPGSRTTRPAARGARRALQSSGTVHTHGFASGAGDGPSTGGPGVRENGRRRARRVGRKQKGAEEKCPKPARRNALPFLRARAPAHAGLARARILACALPRPRRARPASLEPSSARDTLFGSARGLAAAAEDTARALVPRAPRPARPRPAARGGPSPLMGALDAYTRGVRAHRIAGGERVGRGRGSAGTRMPVIARVRAVAHTLPSRSRNAPVALVQEDARRRASTPTSATGADHCRRSVKEHERTLRGAARAAASRTTHTAARAASRHRGRGAARGRAHGTRSRARQRGQRLEKHAGRAARTCRGGRRARGARVGGGRLRRTGSPRAHNEGSSPRQAGDRAARHSRAARSRMDGSASSRRLGSPGLRSRDGALRTRTAP